jgi:hypothetical protein
MLVEGSSMRSISRLADVSINTVMKLPLVSQGAHKWLGYYSSLAAVASSWWRSPT